MHIQVPPGSFAVRASFEDTGARQIGNRLSLVGMIALVAWLGWAGWRVIAGDRARRDTRSGADAC
jgi:hypothetical protein